MPKTLDILWDVYPQQDGSAKMQARWLASNGQEMQHDLVYKGAPFTTPADDEIEEAKALIAEVASEIERSIEAGKYRPQHFGASI